MAGPFRNQSVEQRLVERAGDERFIVAGYFLPCLGRKRIRQRLTDFFIGSGSRGSQRRADHDEGQGQPAADLRFPPDGEKQGQSCHAGTSRRRMAIPLTAGSLLIRSIDGFAGDLAAERDGFAVVSLLVENHTAGRLAVGFLRSIFAFCFEKTFPSSF